MKYFWFDAHCDALMHSAGKNGSITRNRRHFDLERAVKNGAGVQVLALFPPSGLPAFEAAERMLAAAEAALKETGIPLCLTGGSLLKLRDTGKFGVLLSLEGADALDGDLTRLDYFYRRGVRLLGLTWNNDNALCGGCGANSTGLSALGAEGVRKWEALGGLTDVSHASASGFWDVLSTCEKPVIASHSCCNALCAHKRNLNDEQIRALAQKGGVIGVNFFPEFLSETGTATIDGVTAHILHIVNTGGEDAAGLGSDFDGIETTPEGLTGTQDIPALAAALERRKLPGRIIEKIMGGNFYRVFSENL